MPEDPHRAAPEGLRQRGDAVRSRWQQLAPLLPAVRCNLPATCSALQHFAAVFGSGGLPPPTPWSGGRQPLVANCCE
eukprot:15437659-Alexandrium_andersonii.AAC.1